MGKESMHPQKKGFTLLELMTVATLIGILTAIAVPNFLNATYRARIARSQAEIEGIVWALEMYSIDCDAYPLNEKSGTSNVGDLVPLTQPIPYLSSIPEDIFLSPTRPGSKEYIETERNGNPYYAYVNFLQTDGQRRPLRPYGQNGTANYTVYGFGPAFTRGCDPMIPPSFILYTPSNGMISQGVIGVFAP